MVVRWCHFADVVLYFQSNWSRKCSESWEKATHVHDEYTCVTPYRLGTEALMSDWYRIGMPETVNLYNDK